MFCSIGFRKLRKPRPEQLRVDLLPNEVIEAGLMEAAAAVTTSTVIHNEKEAEIFSVRSQHYCHCCHFCKSNVFFDALF